MSWKMQKGSMKLEVRPFTLHSPIIFLENETSDMVLETVTECFIDCTAESNEISFICATIF